jgi:beta-fructofuranosidase
MTGDAGRLRPALHFAPARNWMNDPNGLIQWGGVVHLFYQHNPRGVAHGHVAWGHASSPDLWTWTDHPLALQPDPDGPDRDGCFSGCAVVSDGQPHLIYTGVNGRHQLPCLAAADGPDLIRWTRYERNPVIASPPSGEAVAAFRDHSAWWADSTWYQVVGGGLYDRGGALFLYRSPDLRDWQYVGLFATAADHGLEGAIWECPDVFVLGETMVVVVSVLNAKPTHAMWMAGPIPSDTFVPRVSGRCDNANRYYAPQSLTLADGRRVAIGWLRESVDELTGSDRSRVGVMSLPRELYLDANGLLRSRPARELDGARRETLVSQTVRASGIVDLKLSAGAAHATELMITPVHGEVVAFGLRLAGLGCEDVTIAVTAGGVQISEGTRALTATSPVLAGASTPADPVGQVRVYYDNGILEVYSPAASPAVVICDRHGSYDRVEVEVSSRPGAPPSTARITAWSSGGAEVAA